MQNIPAVFLRSPQREVAEFSPPPQCRCPPAEDEHDREALLLPLLVHLSEPPLSHPMKNTAGPCRECNPPRVGSRHWRTRQLLSASLAQGSPDRVVKKCEMIISFHGRRTSQVKLRVGQGWPIFYRKGGCVCRYSLKLLNYITN